MAGSYLDPLLNVEVDAAGAIVAKAGGAAGGGINFVSPLTAVRNPQTGKVDVGGSTSSGAWSFADITLPPEAAPASPSSGWLIYVDSATGQLTAKDSAGNTVIMSTDRTTITGVKTLNANNITAHVALFQFTGDIVVKRLYGVVTVGLGINQTACQFTGYDQSTRATITGGAGGTNMSGLSVSTMLVLQQVVSSGALTTAAVPGDGWGLLPTTIQYRDLTFSAKLGATSVIEYTYTTTDAPTSGAMQFYLVWYPLTTDATVTAV